MKKIENTNPSETQTARAADMATSDAASVLSNPKPTPSADEHQGVGGLYEMVDGKRQLVARTQVAQA